MQIDSRFHHKTSYRGIAMKFTILSFVLIALSTAVFPATATSIPFANQQSDNRAIRVQKTEHSERRVALVIGNSAYKDSPLRNPVNDSRDMAQALRRLGFEVVYGENLSQNEMKRSIRVFGDKIRDGGVGLFYYAGHGVQVNGRNYLIPVDAIITKEAEVEFESIDVGFALAQMEEAHNRLNIVILDACRNNPFARGFRSVRSGLASIDAPAGTLIAYATAPGSVASDGDGRNGLYTLELLNAMRVSGAKIEDVFKRVRSAIQSKTTGKQIPWESSSLTGDFYFSEENSPKSDRVEKTLIPVKDVDRADPSMTATAILQAYKARDLVALAELSRSLNRDMFSELVRQGESHPRYKSIFSGWRWQAVQAWQGQIDEVRYRQVRNADASRLEARVKFGEIRPDEYAVVTMIWEDGKWCFEDINSPNRTYFESNSKIRPR